MFERKGYEEAVLAIAEGRATPRALWVIVSARDGRDGYALRPEPWEGPGEYQHVIIDGRSRLIRLPDDARSLRACANQSRATPDPQEARA